jgi:hypothetical protein
MLEQYQLCITHDVAWFVCCAQSHFYDSLHPTQPVEMHSLISDLVRDHTDNVVRTDLMDLKFRRHVDYACELTLLIEHCRARMISTLSP